MSWNPFDPIAEAPFKPVAGGYLYQATSPWPFVRGQRFRVTEAQKAELVIRHRTMLRAVFWLTLIGGAVGGVLAAAVIHDRGWKMLAICGLVGLAMGYPARLWLVRKVRPMLGQLAPTDERITGWDRFKRQAVVFSPGFLLAFGLLSLALTALEVWSGISGSNGWDTTTVFGTALFGFCTIYWAVLYAMRRMSTSEISNDQQA
jgi:MFS family permease